MVTVQNYLPDLTSICDVYERFSLLFIYLLQEHQHASAQKLRLPKSHVHVTQNKFHPVDETSLKDQL